MSTISFTEHCRRKSDRIYPLPADIPVPTNRYECAAFLDKKLTRGPSWLSDQGERWIFHKPTRSNRSVSLQRQLLKNVIHQAMEDVGLREEISGHFVDATVDNYTIMGCMRQLQHFKNKDWFSDSILLKEIKTVRTDKADAAKKFYKKQGMPKQHIESGGDTSAASASLRQHDMVSEDETTTGSRYPPSIAEMQQSLSHKLKDPHRTRLREGSLADHDHDVESDDDGQLSPAPRSRRLRPMRQELNEDEERREAWRQEDNDWLLDTSDDADFQSAVEEEEEEEPRIVPSRRRRLSWDDDDDDDISLSSSSQSNKKARTGKVVPQRVPNQDHHNRTSSQRGAKTSKNYNKSSTSSAKKNSASRQTEALRATIRSTAPGRAMKNTAPTKILPARERAPSQKGVQYYASR